MPLLDFFSGKNFRCQRIPYTREQLQKLFMHHDANGDNLLSKAEVREIFEYLESRNPGFRAWQAMGKADTNGDGKIDQKEMEDLLNFVAGLNYKI